MGVVQLLHLLPAAVLRALDAWSYQVARRRQRERQQRWQRRQAVPVAEAPAPYKLKPWRD
jgi:hypothetical protein